MNYSWGRSKNLGKRVQINNGFGCFANYCLFYFRKAVHHCYGATWHGHLGTLRKLHTKLWFAHNSSMQLLFVYLSENPDCTGGESAKDSCQWTCRRWRNTSSVGDMLDELEWPSLEALREQSSLTFFYKIHSGTVSLDKDKYRTPAPNIRRTRTTH